MTTTKPDTYQQVTDKLIEMLESAKEYGLPWHRLGMDAISPINVVSGNTYRGINIPMLWVSAEQNGYTHGRWATYKQWSDLGAQVKKGEKSTAVVFWKQFTYENDEGEVEKAGMFVRVYHVFNCAQVDGYEIPTTITLPEIERISSAEAYFDNTRAIIRHGGDSAYYRTTSDHIQMPNINQFKDSVSYYAVLAHETTHWTGHTARLDRAKGKRFGDMQYAAEELIAELGAAFLCAKLGLSPEPRPDHAAYLASWLKMLKNDKKAIFTAASMAQKACDYLDGLQSPSISLAA